MNRLAMVPVRNASAGNGGDNRAGAGKEPWREPDQRDDDTAPAGISDAAATHHGGDPKNGILHIVPYTDWSKQIVLAILADFQAGRLLGPLRGVILVARSYREVSRVRAEFREALTKLAQKEHVPVDGDTLDNFIRLIHYYGIDLTNIDFGVDGPWSKLKAWLYAEDHVPTSGECVWWIATDPSVTLAYVRAIKQASLITSLPCKPVAYVDKPIGVNGATCSEINDALDEVFGPENVFRYDHYSFGFAIKQCKNSLREDPLLAAAWNPLGLHHIEIVADEAIGVEPTRFATVNKMGNLVDMAPHVAMWVLAAHTSPEALFSPDPKEFVEGQMQVLTSLEFRDLRVGIYSDTDKVEGYETMARRLGHSGVLRPNAFSFWCRSASLPVWTYVRAGKGLPIKENSLTAYFSIPPHSQIHHLPESQQLLPFRRWVRIRQGGEMATVRNVMEGMTWARRPGIVPIIEPAEFTVDPSRRYGGSGYPPIAKMIGDAHARKFWNFLDRKVTEALWQFIVDPLKREYEQQLAANPGNLIRYPFGTLPQALITPCPMDEEIAHPGQNGRSSRNDRSPHGRRGAAFAV